MAAKLNIIELITADLTASLAFYRRLGIDIPHGLEAEEHIEVQLDHGMTLAWDTAELVTRINPRYERPSGGARIAMAFQCDGPSEVDRIYADLTTAGGHGEIEPFDASWGPRYALVLDPDGNAVQLYAPAA